MEYQTKTMKGAGPSGYTLAMGILVVMVVFLFGASLFLQSITNGGYTGAQSNYPLAVQVSKFNATVANFTSQFIQQDQVATTTPVNQNPGILSGLGNGASVIGLMWSMLTQLSNLLGASLLVLAPWVPAWLSFVAMAAVAFMFMFAALGYILRWFV